MKNVIKNKMTILKKIENEFKEYVIKRVSEINSIEEFENLFDGTNKEDEELSRKLKSKLFNLINEVDEIDKTYKESKEIHDYLEIEGEKFDFEMRKCLSERLEKNKGEK